LIPAHRTPHGLFPHFPRLSAYRALERIRAFHLQVTQEVLRKLAHGNDRRAIDEVSSFQCR
jgi:hypothetical protein